MTHVKYDMKAAVERGAANYRKGKTGGAYEMQDTIQIGTMRGLIKIAIPESIINHTIDIQIEPKKMWWQAK